MKKILFYDLDGTLIDTAEDIMHAANHMLQEMFLPTLSRAQVSQYVGKGLRYLIQNCLKIDDPKIIDRGGKLYRDHYATHMMDHSVPFPGAEAFLKAFDSAKQYVVTNKPDPFATDMLKELKVDHFFEAIVPGNGTYPRKPDPESVLDLTAKQGMKVADALFVGDSLIDIETAKNAGMEVAVISHGFSSEDELKSGSPDFLVSDWQELLKLAEKEGWLSP